MTGLKRFFLLCVCFLSALLLNGQNNYLNKKVNLPTGQVILKTALKTISIQTGCVFSYDPTKIVDKQLISISTKGSLSLRSALLEVLPKDIQFKLNGKYIVLQEAINKPVIKPETITIKLPKQNKSSNLNTKCRGTIDKNPSLERLVLPPLESNSDKKFVAQVVDPLSNRGGDSIDFTLNTVPLQEKDTNLLFLITADTVSEKQALTNVIQKPDTIKIVKPGLGNFIKKNGYLEAGISINSQLAALSVHAGLYNIYAILSIGSDYNDSYLIGIGAGAGIRIDTHFSLNFDFLQNAVIAGKSYLLQVKASNTQLIPVLNYLLGRSIKIFAGPTVNLIKSSYVSSISTTDLGLLVGVGYSVGIKVDLKSLLSKKNESNNKKVTY